MASVFMGSTGTEIVSVRSQVEHSNVRFSKPRWPGEIRAKAILCLHAGHIGLSFGELPINLPKRHHTPRPIRPSARLAPMRLGSIPRLRLSVAEDPSPDVGHRRGVARGCLEPLVRSGRAEVTFEARAAAPVVATQQSGDPSCSHRCLRAGGAPVSQNGRGLGPDPRLPREASHGGRGGPTGVSVALPPGFGAQRLAGATWSRLCPS